MFRTSRPQYLTTSALTGHQGEAGFSEMVLSALGIVGDKQPRKAEVTCDGRWWAPDVYEGLRNLLRPQEDCGLEAGYLGSPL